MSLRAVSSLRKLAFSGALWLQLACPTMAQMGSVSVDAEELENDGFGEQEEIDSDLQASERSGYSISLNYNSSVHFNGLKGYDDYCGSAGGMPQVKADKTAAYYGFPVKVGIGFGYYKDKCKTAKAGSTGTDLVFTETGGTSLKLIPFQLTVGTTFELPSFPFFNVDMQTGFEHLIVEESRIVLGADASNTDSSDTESSGGGGLVLTTSANSLIYNIGVNLLLNKLDEKSANSLYQSLGLGKVYLRTFVESTIALGSNEPNFDRLAIGIGFGFASGKP